MMYTHVPTNFWGSRHWNLFTCFFVGWLCECCSNIIEALVKKIPIFVVLFCQVALPIHRSYTTLYPVAILTTMIFFKNRINGKSCRQIWLHTNPTRLVRPGILAFLAVYTYMYMNCIYVHAMYLYPCTHTYAHTSTQTRSHAHAHAHTLTRTRTHKHPHAHTTLDALLLRLWFVFGRPSTPLSPAAVVDAAIVAGTGGVNPPSFDCVCFAIWDSSLIFPLVVATALASRNSVKIMYVCQL